MKSTKICESSELNGNSLQIKFLRKSSSKTSKIQRERNELKQQSLVCYSLYENTICMQNRKKLCHKNQRKIFMKRVRQGHYQFNRKFCKNQLTKMFVNRNFEEIFSDKFVNSTFMRSWDK